MHLILSGISIVSGFAIGNFLAAESSARLKSVNALFSSVEALKTRIISYSEGLKEAVFKGSLAESCVFFKELEQNLDSPVPMPISLVIRDSPYTSNIKEQLTMLFDCISNADEDNIRKAFDAALSAIEKEKNILADRKAKNAPLYRKIGLLSGIAVAILLL